MAIGQNLGQIYDIDASIMLMCVSKPPPAMHMEINLDLTKLTTLTPFWWIKTKLPQWNTSLQQQTFTMSLSEKIIQQKVMGTWPSNSAVLWDKKEYISITKASQCFHTKADTSHILESSVDRRHICLQNKKLEPISCLLLGGPSVRIFNQPCVRRMICLFVLNCPAGRHSLPYY